MLFRSVFVILLVVSAARSDVIHVDDDACPGPGDGSEESPYCLIQKAIFNAVTCPRFMYQPE